MATATDGKVKANGYIFQWKIQNLNHCWWLKKSEGIDSPAFIADELSGTKWSLSLYPMGFIDEKYIGFYLNREKDCGGPIDFEVCFDLAFLNKHGSILVSKGDKGTFAKSQINGSPHFQERERVFVTCRDRFLPEDALTVQCTLWSIHNVPSNPKYLYARTIFTPNRRTFVWNIDLARNPESKLEKRNEDNLICFKLVFNKQKEELNLDVVSIDDSLRCISFIVSAIDLDEKKKVCGIQEYSRSELRDEALLQLPYPEIAMMHPNRYLRNNCLSLEFVLWTVRCTSFRQNFAKFEDDLEAGGPPHPRILTDCLESMYTDENFTDVEIRVGNRGFKVHKAILSARSPVFHTMFHTDMLESISGYVVIGDFDEGTVEQMLRFMYTDIVTNRGLENVKKLLAIANKYAMESLKQRCSYFLQELLQPANVLDILVLADLHNDVRLKKSVIEYILGLPKRFFRSQEWKDFMTAQQKLTIEVFYEKELSGSD